MQMIEKPMSIKTLMTQELKDPHSGEIKDTIFQEEQKDIRNKNDDCEPYLHFIDTSNRAMPEFQKEKCLSIKQSNLCSEIILSTNKDRTTVCCLSSLNLEYYDEWKDNPSF